jgi:TM2 domain-containing membrane protein YozV/RNA polymerase subunit RPABC4/transcription elongation factor Spt4
MKYCINCGEDIQESAEICTNCGVNQSTRLEGDYEERGADQVYCFECGELIYRQAELCPECGTQQPTQTSAAGSKGSDQVAAGILAILLGGIGVHKFYQGNTRNGVLYLCFFWTGIPAILGLIEGILMLMVEPDEYEQKYADGSILGQ